jgi:hypothetical protein
MSYVSPNEYIYAMFGILFVLALDLRDELLGGIVIPSDDTADSTYKSVQKGIRCLTIRDKPKFEK